MDGSNWWAEPICPLLLSKICLHRAVTAKNKAVEIVSSTANFIFKAFNKVYFQLTSPRFCLYSKCLSVIVFEFPFKTESLTLLLLGSLQTIHTHCLGVDMKSNGKQSKELCCFARRGSHLAWPDTKLNLLQLIHLTMINITSSRYLPCCTWLKAFMT